MNPALSLGFLASASYYYVLPFLSVFIIVVGGQAIGMRSMCIYELGTDYVRYAKLLGIRENKILYYMFRNAMLPQLTGLQRVEHRAAHPRPLQRYFDGFPLGGLGAYVRLPGRRPPRPVPSA